MSIRLVLVRHGLSSFNEKGLVQGRTDDSYLTDKGYEQALKSGEALSGIRFRQDIFIPTCKSSRDCKDNSEKLKTRK
jgi:probable phosphoglycerate mutase